MDAVATADGTAAVATLDESAPLSLLSALNTSPRNSAILATTEDEVSCGLSDELLSPVSPDDEPAPLSSAEGSAATSLDGDAGGPDSTGAGAGSLGPAGSGSDADTSSGAGEGGGAMGMVVPTSVE